MKVEMKITGFDELLNKMDKLPPLLHKRILRASGRRAMKLVLETAKGIVPVRTGRLRDAIKITTRQNRQRRQLDIRVGPSNIPYAHLVEDGTSSHTIKVKKASFLGWGNKTFGIKVDHPGAKAQPYMRPALDENRDKIISFLKVDLKKSIDRAVRKMLKAKGISF